MYGKYDWGRFGGFWADLFHSFAPPNLSESYPGPKIEGKPKENLTPKQKDAKAMASDWKDVGKSIESIISKDTGFINDKVKKK